MIEPNSSWLEINVDSEFPHTPSRWERIPITVRLLKPGRRGILGNLSNLRSIYFNKSFSEYTLSSFSLQESQIIRFLAVNIE